MVALSGSSEGIAKKLQKISENGQSKSKLNVSSESIPLNFHNTKTELTFQKLQQKLKSHIQQMS